MRNISISTSFDYTIPIHIQIPMIKDAGFSHVSIGGNYDHSGILDKSELIKLKELLDMNNIFVDTVHGYILDKKDAIEINQRIVDAAVYLSAPVVVIHCSSFTFNPATLEKRTNDINLKIVELEHIAKKSGVKFAIENVLPGVATDFAEAVINRVNPEYFGFCYDSSHGQVDGPRDIDLLERLQNRLSAIHISDRIKEFVDHVIPGEGFINFHRICEVIKSSPFRAPFLMEVMIANSQYKDPKEFLRLTYERATELYDLIY